LSLEKNSAARRRKLNGNVRDKAGAVIRP